MRKLIHSDGSETDLIVPHQICQIKDLIGADMLDNVLLKDREHVMLVDDIGHKKGLPINKKATDLYWEKCGGQNDHVIRGDVVIVPDNDFA